MLSCIRYSIVQKQGINRVLKWFVGLIVLEQQTARDKKAVWPLEKLLAASAAWYDNKNIDIVIFSLLNAILQCMNTTILSCMHELRNLLLSLRKPSLMAHLVFQEIPFWNI